MTLRELIDALTELAESDETLADAPVMFAHQPNWPLQCGVVGPKVVCEEDEAIAELEEELGNLDSASADAELDSADEVAMREELERLRSRRCPIVYLAEGGSRWVGDRELSPYAPRSAWPD